MTGAVGPGPKPPPREDQSHLGNESQSKPELKELHKKVMEEFQAKHMTDQKTPTKKVTSAKKGFSKKLLSKKLSQAASFLWRYVKMAGTGLEETIKTYREKITTQIDKKLSKEDKEFIEKADIFLKRNSEVFEHIPQLIQNRLEVDLSEDNIENRSIEGKSLKAVKQFKKDNIERPGNEVTIIDKETYPITYDPTITEPPFQGDNLLIQLSEQIDLEKEMKWFTLAQAMLTQAPLNHAVGRLMELKPEGQLNIVNGKAHDIELRLPREYTLKINRDKSGNIISLDMNIKGFNELLRTGATQDERGVERFTKEEEIGEIKTNLSYRITLENDHPKLSKFKIDQKRIK